VKRNLFALQRLAGTLAAAALLLPAVPGCPPAPGDNTNDNDNGNLNDNDNGNDNDDPNEPAALDERLIGAWFSDETLEGFQIDAEGGLNPLDADPDGRLREMPGTTYRGVTLSVLSAADNIIRFRGEQRLRLPLDGPRQIALRGRFETRDEYLFSDDGQQLTILTELFGADDGERRDRFYRRVQLGDAVGDPHNITFDVAGAVYTADAQSVEPVGDEIRIYGEFSSLITIYIVAPNEVGTHALAAGGTARVRIVQQELTNVISEFETLSGTLEISAASASETAGEFSGEVRNLADRSDVRPLQGSFRVSR
jgi:hypothetical protein